MYMCELVKKFNASLKDNLEDCDFSLDTSKKTQFVSNFYNVTKKLLDLGVNSYDFKYSNSYSRCNFRGIHEDVVYENINLCRSEERMCAEFIHGDTPFDVTYVSKTIIEDKRCSTTFWEIENKNPEYYFRCDTFEELKEHVRENSDKYFP